MMRKPIGTEEGKKALDFSGNFDPLPQLSAVNIRKITVAPSAGYAQNKIFVRAQFSPLFNSHNSFSFRKMSRHPIVKWAQRSDKVYITVDLPDAKNVKLKLEPEGKFIFSATRDDLPYEVELDLFDKVKVEESKYNIGVRNIAYVIKKEEKKWWSRLVKQEGKPPVFLKVDWDKWVDEDEENEKGRSDFDDMDFSKLNMGEDDFDMDEMKDEEDQIEEEEERKEAEAEPSAEITGEAKA